MAVVWVLAGFSQSRPWQWAAQSAAQAEASDIETGPKRLLQHFALKKPPTFNKQINQIKFQNKQKYTT